MAAPVSHKEIPLTMPLYHRLGFSSTYGQSSQTIASPTYAWRRQYFERYGLVIRDLLDWNKNRNQFRSIAATFLMNDRHGETYWPPKARSKAGIPEYPRDQALLVDLLSQLFWRQIQNEHNCRNRTRSHDASDSGLDSKQLTDGNDIQELPNLARPPNPSLNEKSSIAPCVPKVPVFHENWEWPHLQLGRTRSARLPTAKAVQTIEATQKNSHDIKVPKVATKRSAGPSEDNAGGPMDLAKNDEIGHPSSAGTSQKSSGLPGGNSTISPSILHGSKEKHETTETVNPVLFDRHAGRLQYWKRQRDVADAGQPRFSLAATNAKRSRLSLGSRSSVTPEPLPYGIASGSVGSRKESVSETKSGQTALAPPRGLDDAHQSASLSKSAEIHYNIITARKPRLCNVTWTRGGLSNRTWAGLMEEVSQYIEGAYIEGITFTLQMQDAIYTTFVDRQDENVFIHMRNRWMRIIREEMAEGVSSVFEVELEPKHGAHLRKVELDADVDYTL